jgi:hypothetical protein
MTPPIGRLGRGLSTALGMLLLAAACGGSGTPSPTPTPTPTPAPTPAGNTCAVAATTEQTPSDAPVSKGVSTGDRKMRRARVYEEIWKHQAAVNRRRAGPASVAPASTAVDVGDIAVIRDQGDVILPPNAFDLRAASVAFARNGSGGYDVRRSARQFQRTVGDKLALGDDDSTRVALPASFPFYAGRYADVFVNSDGNVTFGAEDRASTDRNVARLLSGPPRIAPVFDDLDPTRAGGIYRLVDGDALLVTWCDVPEFGNTGNRISVQLRLGADGSIDIVYGSAITTSSAVVGVSPGTTGIFSAIDISTATTSTPIAGGTGAVGERFATNPDLDFVALTRKFYESHGDDFDQLVLYTNVRTTELGTFAFEFTVANEVGGIGLDVYDNSRDFGSRARLRSIVNMDMLQHFPNDPRQRFLGENNTLSLMGQECGHRWLAFLDFRDGSINSTELLGRDESHWSFFFDSDASNMEGNDIEDVGNGVFRTIGAVSRYSALDQYAMGLRAASEVPPMFLVTRVTSGQNAGDAPRIGIEIRGARKDVTIADVVAANGARRPDSTTAQKTFRQAFIYLVSQAAESNDDLLKLEGIRSAWETYFSDSTERRGTMIARLR